MDTHKLSNKLQTIASTYLSISRMLQVDSFHSQSFKENQYSNFCFTVELAYSSLSAPLKRIINNDFFYQDYPGWWKLCYKRHEYLKLRELAIKRFMEAYYEIN